MNVKILNKSIPFDKAAEFSEVLKSPAGSLFLISTKCNEPRMTISVQSLAKPGIKEYVMQIPLGKKPYSIGLSAVIPGPEPTEKPKPKPDVVVIGGPEPEESEPKPDEKPTSKHGFIGHYIVIGGPEPQPGKTEKESEPLYIELDATHGSWQIEPTDEFLNVSFHGSKPK